MPRSPTTKLNVYLLKNGVDVADAISGKLREPVDITAGGKTIGQLYLYKAPPKQAGWTYFFTEQKSKLSSLLSAGSGGLFHIQGSRSFLLSFGYASHQVDKNMIEPDFGLRVTLNSVEGNKLRSVDAFTPDALGRQTRTQASRLGSIPEFGLNIDQDLLRTVSAQPTDDSLGQRMSGKDNLTVNVKTDVAGLPELLETYLGRFRAKAYKKDFAWIDKIREVRDRQKIADLDGRLAKQFQLNAFEKTWMAVPEIVEWERIKGFRYGLGTKGSLDPDLHVSRLRESFREPSTIAVEQLKKSVKAYSDEEARFPSYDWTAYSCIYCEIELGGDVFLLTNGKWFRVSSDFVEQVTNAIKRIPERRTLPNFEHATEEEYNKAVAKSSGGKLALLDRKSIHVGGGRSQVEFCDLYGKDGRMIHVKRYGGSGVLSHLFQQGVNSATLWTIHEEFRQKVNTKLPRTHKLADPLAQIDRERFKTVFAITTKKDQPLWKSLPFFSKLSLRNAREQLRALGYSVELERIMDPTE